MELLYPHEHVTCFNYETGDGSAVELFYFKDLKSNKIDFHSTINTVLFVLKGAINISYDKFVNQDLAKGKMLLLPAMSKFRIEAKGSAVFFSIRLNRNLHFCDHYSLEMLNKETKSTGSDKFLNTLTINERVQAYLDTLFVYFKDGLRCSYFFDIKIKELFYILRAYYPKDDLKRFFSPMLSNDLHFSSFIFNNYQKAKSVKDLADMSHYSLTGFEKRFKKVFGTSAHQWVKTQRAKSIYHEINCSQKTFSEIGFEFGFSSPSHFNNFCKTVFGSTPSHIRQQKINEYMAQ